jgi:hypothetical protein
VTACVSTASSSTPAIVPFGTEIADTGWTVLSPFSRKATGQLVTVDRTPIRGISVPLLTGNHFSDTGDVTMWLASVDGRVLATVNARLDVGSAGWVRFSLPSKGLDVPPGTQLRLWLANQEREMFGWRYAVNHMRQGGAIMVGRPDPRFDFLYRLEH